MNVQTIGVIGVGQMGNGIAHVLSAADHEVNRWHCQVDRTSLLG